MKSIISELYRGNIAPRDKIIIRTPEQCELLDRLDESEKRLNRYFAEKRLYRLKAAFERHMDMLISVMEADGTDNFSDGFILGAGLMNEIQQKQ